LQCRYQDDMWFSAHLARKGIQRLVLGGAVGVQELKDMHLGPSSLTFWQENRPRQVSMDCNSALLQLQPDLWARRRRLVLAIGGLPPISSLPAQTEDITCANPKGKPTSQHFRSKASWSDVVSALQNLPRTPDLTYLCTSISAENEQDRGIQVDNQKLSFGASFLLGGILATFSDACKAYAEEPRVGDLLSNPLRWEGDFNTIVVVGTLSDISSGGQSLVDVADCAAKLFDADTLTQDTKPSNPNDKFCRIGGLASIGVGAFNV